MNLNQVTEFVEASKIAITDANKFARCVDGRYENIVDMPLGAKPGGDVGDVIAAFGALNLLQKHLDPQVVIDTVLKLTDGANHFNFHTDTHADPSAIGLGCGHLKQAKLDPVAYGLTQDQIDFLANALPGLLEQGAHQEVLQGDHAEQAVVVVDSEAYGVVPLLRNGEDLQEAFVYQKTLHGKQLDKLANLLQESLAAKAEVVESADVRKALDEAFGKQLTETLKRLADGLPVYVAKINAEGQVEIAE
ncbi:MAG TPA: hypothetical protein VHQ41_01790 [Patescibacteria group bacterium]|jgi:hypothetical protein|nr:hypothetical protein [Patescibacteria group bacterium]